MPKVPIVLTPSSFWGVLKRLRGHAELCLESMEGNRDAGKAVFRLLNDGKQVAGIEVTLLFHEPQAHWEACAQLITVPGDQA